MDIRCPQGEHDTPWEERFNANAYCLVGDRLPRSWNEACLYLLIVGCWRGFGSYRENLRSPSIMYGWLRLRLGRWASSSSENGRDWCRDVCQQGNNHSSRPVCIGLCRRTYLNQWHHVLVTEAPAEENEVEDWQVVRSDSYSPSLLVPQILV